MVLLILIGIRVFGGGSETQVGSFAQIEEAASSTTLDPGEVACVRRVREVEMSHNAAARQAEEDYADGRLPDWGGNKAREEFGDSLVAIDLTGCPSDFVSAYTSYAFAWRELGRWIHDNSGVSNIFSRGSEDEREQLNASVISANSAVNDVLDVYAPDLRLSWRL